MIVIKVKTGGGCNATFTSAAPATATQYVLSPARPLLPPHPSVAEFLTAYTLYVHKVGRTMALSSSVRTKVPCSRKCGAFSIVTPEDGAEGKPSLHFFSLAPMESSACAGKCSWCIDDRMIGWCSWCMCKEQVRLFFFNPFGLQICVDVRECLGFGRGRYENKRPLAVLVARDDTVVGAASADGHYYSHALKH